MGLPHKPARAMSFTTEQIEGFFDSARLARYGYATLGSQ